MERVNPIIFPMVRGCHISPPSPPPCYLSWWQGGGVELAEGSPSSWSCWFHGASLIWHLHVVASGQRVIDNAKDIYLVVVNDTANVRSPLQIDEYIPLIIIIIISSDSKITFVIKCFKIPCQQNDSGKDNPILANDINRVIPGKVTIRVDEKEENGTLSSSSPSSSSK